MLSQAGLTIFFIFGYVWFIVGFILIAFPAIKEIFSMFSKK